LEVGALMSSGTVAVLASDDNVYKEVTLDVPQTVTATTYILAAMADDGNIQYRYKNGSGAMDAWSGKMYSAFPYDPIGTPGFDDLARDLEISLYVD
jgi:hypothetical protein